MFCVAITIFSLAEFVYRIKQSKSTQNDQLKSEKGWILIDSILGIFILSTAVIALLLAFTQSTKGSVTSTNRTQATYLAQQTLENLKLQDGSKTIDTTVVPSSDKYTIVIDTPAVSAITNALDLNIYLKPYRVTVSWSDTVGGPATKNVQMVRYCYVNP